MVKERFGRRDREDEIYCYPYFIPDPQDEVFPDIQKWPCFWYNGTISLHFYHKNVQYLLNHTIEFAEKVASYYDLIEQGVDLKALQFYLKYILIYYQKMLGYEQSFREIVAVVPGLTNLLATSKRKLDFINEHEPLILMALHLSAIRLYDLLVKLPPKHLR